MRECESKVVEEKQRLWVCGEECGWDGNGYSLLNKDQRDRVCGGTCLFRVAGSQQQQRTPTAPVRDTLLVYYRRRTTYIYVLQLRIY